MKTFILVAVFIFNLVSLADAQQPVTMQSLLADGYAIVAATQGGSVSILVFQKEQSAFWCSFRSFDFSMEECISLNRD